MGRAVLMQLKVGFLIDACSGRSHNDILEMNENSWNIVEAVLSVIIIATFLGITLTCDPLYKTACDSPLRVHCSRVATVSTRCHFNRPTAPLISVMKGPIVCHFAGLFRRRYVGWHVRCPSGVSILSRFRWLPFGANGNTNGTFSLTIFNRLRNSYLKPNQLLVTLPHSLTYSSINSPIYPFYTKILVPKLPQFLHSPSASLVTRSVSESNSLTSQVKLCMYRQA